MENDLYLFILFKINIYFYLRLGEGVGDLWLYAKLFCVFKSKLLNFNTHLNSNIYL